MKQKNIAIVGAGFAGLASAILLHRAGHRVQLFDRFKNPNSIGAGILIQPTGMQAMRELGILDDMLECGAPINRLYGLAGNDPKQQQEVLNIQYKDWKKPSLFPANGLGLHRGSLFSCLWNLIEILDIPVTINHAIDSLQVLQKENDLVILATGAHCELRKQLDTLVKCKPYPWGAVWTILEDKENIYQGELLQWYQSASKMFGIMPTGRLKNMQGEIENKSLVSVFWSLPVDQYDTWRNKGLDETREQILALNPQAQPLLLQMSSMDEWTFATYADVRMPRKMHSGNCIVIGDAAHAFSPQLGQGTNMALVDAVCLAKALNEKDDVAQAFKQYQKQRAKQLKFYSHASRVFTPMYQSHQKFLPWCRDYIVPPIIKHVPFAKAAQVEILVGVRQSWFR